MHRQNLVHFVMRDRAAVRGHHKFVAFVIQPDLAGGFFKQVDRRRCVEAEVIRAQPRRQCRACRPEFHHNLHFARADACQMFAQARQAKAQKAARKGEGFTQAGKAVKLAFLAREKRVVCIKPHLFDAFRVQPRKHRVAMAVQRAQR